MNQIKKQTDSADSASQTEEMRTHPQDLLRKLRAWGLEIETFSHVPVFTVAESKLLRGTIIGGHCKTLFLKSKKGRLYLLVALEETRIDLNQLARDMGQGRLSFANPELLWQCLSVRPGSVTPFALINDTDCEIEVILDAAMLRCERLNFHPLVNSMTTAISNQGLLDFLGKTGHSPLIRNLPTPPAS